MTWPGWWGRAVRSWPSISSPGCSLAWPARAARAGLADRIETRLCQADDLGLSEAVDFAAAFYMVHETPDQTALLIQVSRVLKPGASFLIVEPSFHVSEEDFLATIASAEKVGLKAASRPRLAFSRTVVLSNSGDA